MRPMTPEELAARKDNLPKSARQAAEQGMAHEWAWRQKPVHPRNPPKPKVVFGQEVGVGEDFSHLSKRRQRTREETVTREVEWLHELEKARREGARASARR